ncbi:uncharacterized protein LOC126837195 [Adelges cooleyi]|uniref:uncharacterized protein LOC126837195 n=1 Tax=Adelges cooleyi TaxID=133065 RepID=UPI00217F593A|nr:uncharacterized protein LOC126837195 [Adelges cooleyi]
MTTQLQFTTADTNGRLIEPISTPVAVKRRLFDDENPFWDSDYQNLTGVLPLPELAGDNPEDRLRGSTCTFTDLTLTDSSQISVTSSIAIEKTPSAANSVQKEPTDQTLTQKHLDVTSFYGLQRPNCTLKNVKWFKRNDGKRQYKNTKVLRAKLKSSISQLGRKMRNKFIFFKAADSKKKPKTSRKRSAKKNLPPNRYPLTECIPMLKTFDICHQKESSVKVENASFEENWTFFNLPGPSKENTEDNAFCAYDPLLDCDFADEDDEFDNIPSIDAIIESLFKDESDWHQNDDGFAFDPSFLGETTNGGQTIALSSSTTEVLTDELEELQIANAYQVNDDNAPLSDDFLNL